MKQMSFDEENAAISKTTANRFGEFFSSAQKLNPKSLLLRNFIWNKPSTPRKRQKSSSNFLMSAKFMLKNS